MKKTKKWFSVLISILIIGFLLILTVWTYNIVLRELKDSKWSFDYLKAFSAAEAAWELALLTIKEKWYWYYKKIEPTINDDSIILSDHPTDKTKFNKSKDPLISYDLNYKVKEYNWYLDFPAWFDIIPLFYTDDLWEHKVLDFELNILSWDSSKLTWNIIWKDSGISWIWDIDWNSIWKWRFRDSVFPWKFIVKEKKVWEFLNESDFNYLVLMNIDSANDIEYKITSSYYFTLPRATILATWKVGKYKQNLSIFLDNTEYLWRSRYSIYSN